MSISNLLAQTAIIYTRSGYNKFGRDQSGMGTTVRCRFQNTTKTKLLPNQQVVLLVGIFYFLGTVVISPEDRVVMAGVNYKVFSVNDFIDGHGNQKLIKVEVTAWQT